MEAYHQPAVAFPAEEVAAGAEVSNPAALASVIAAEVAEASVAVLAAVASAAVADAGESVPATAAEPLMLLIPAEEVAAEPAVQRFVQSCGILFQIRKSTNFRVNIVFKTVKQSSVK